MTVLRLEPRYGQGIDRAVAAVDGVTLIRRTDGTYLEASAHDVANLVRALAIEGIESSEVTDLMDDGDKALRARADDLRPASRDLVVIDTVQVRRCGLGEVTRELLRRPFARLRPPSPAARERCRAVLHGEDTRLRCVRIAYLRRDQVRALRSHSSLRTVVFDGGERAFIVFSTEGALARWAFA